MGVLARIKAVFGGTEAKSHDFSGPLPFYDRDHIPRSLAAAFGDDGRGSNVVMAPVFWIMRAFTEAVAVVQSRNAEGVWKRVLDHRVEQLIDQPNEFYDGDALWKATCASYTLDGNAYWRKVRNAYGDVIALWYVPQWMIRPWSPDDGSEFISYYEYSPPGSGPLRLPIRDVVHFRFGVDENDQRLGVSPLKTILREVMTDEEAQVFTAAILDNMGVPGLMVSPADSTFRPTPDQVKELKTEIQNATTGGRRGSTMVMGVPTRLEQFGFDANKLMLPDLRDISEERVCAVLGIDAAVVGFGSGRQSTKVGATLRELRKLAWIQCVTPMQKSLARQATRKLLPDFQSQTRRFRVWFDTSDVSAFLEERLQEAQIARELLTAGAIMRSEAREMCGVDPGENDRVYYVPTNCVLAGPDAAKIETFPTAQPKPVEGDRGGENGEGNLPDPVAARMNGNGNGNGNGTSNGDD